MFVFQHTCTLPTPVGNFAGVEMYTRLRGNIVHNQTRSYTSPPIRESATAKLVKESRLEAALKAVQQNPFDVHGSSLLLQALARKGRLEQCLGVYQTCAEKGKPSVILSSELLRLCKGNKHFQQRALASVWSDIQRYEIKPDRSLVTLLLDASSSCKDPRCVK